MRRVSVAVALAILVVGCGDDDSGFFLPNNTATPTIASSATATPTRSATTVPTATATPVAGTPGPGPNITFFGVTRADDTLLTPDATADDGTPIYMRPPGTTGLASGFVLVVEGKRGGSGARIGTSSYDPTLSGFPDLAVQVTQPLGNGSEAVCDDPRNHPGGVPATSTANLDPTPETIAAVNDFACRFLDGAGEPKARTNASDSCVNFEGRYRFVATETETQYCGFMNVPLGFPPGDTRVIAWLRDERGNWSAPNEIIIRVPS